VRALPEEFEPSVLTASLADDWGFDVESADYAAVGGGSYHWVVTDAAGTRGFVTVDDLDRKPWLGATRESAFAGLRCAFDVAVALRDQGLDFVIAPIATRTGETVVRIGSRYSVALFPFVCGTAGRFGAYGVAERAAITTMLARLHRETPAVDAASRRIDLAVPGRRQLEAALHALDETWSGGPYAERARQALVRDRAGILERLALVDRLGAEVAERSRTWVVTHGEPHAGNVLRTHHGHVLIDWDTVAIAPPERDLWMLTGDGGDELTAYTDATGHELDVVAVELFSLTWALADTAAFVDVLRSPHRADADTAKAYDALTHYLSIPAA
jgi:Phosphotransferase enzyme family